MGRMLDNTLRATGIIAAVAGAGPLLPPVQPAAADLPSTVDLAQNIPRSPRAERLETRASTTLSAKFDTLTTEYRTSTGREFLSDAVALGNDTPVPGSRVTAVNNTVAALLNVPAEMEVSVTPPSKFHIRNNSVGMLAGTVSFEGKRVRFLVDLRQDKIFLNEKEVAANDVANRIRQIHATEPSSVASSPYSTLAALNEASRVGGGVTWIPADNGTARTFFSRMPALQSNSPYVAQYVTAVAQKGSPSGVNDFLRDRGFSTRLDTVPGTEAFYSAGILDIGVQWRTPGSKTQMALQEGGLVPGVLIQNPQAIYTASNTRYPVVELQTKSAARFFITRYDQAIDSQSPFAVLDTCRGITGALKPVSRREARNYRDGVQFPMANYERSGNIEWLSGTVGRESSGRETPLGQTKYVHRFRLNEVGARAQTVDAIAPIATAQPKILSIDGPYLAWYVVPGAANTPGVVPFAIRVTRDDMTDPGTLK